MIKKLCETHPEHSRVAGHCSVQRQENQRKAMIIFYVIKEKRLLSVVLAF